MSVKGQNLSDHEQQDRPLPDYQYDLSPAQQFSLPDFGTASNRDASLNRPVQNESHHDESDPEARHSLQTAPKPSQNRAAFGKWKSKAMSGFPAADVPLPPRITAQKICESFPNHIDDHVILALMREGRGAKAIDALIPPPPGKQKAGQSHSKIQLRISTIREAFPNEVFPITSTKRGRSRSKVPKDERVTFEDGLTSFMSADGVSNSRYTLVRDLNTTGLQTQETQAHLSDAFLAGSQDNTGTAVGSDFRILDTPTGSPSRRAEASPRWASRGPAAAFRPKILQAAQRSHQSNPLEFQIKIEYEKHKQLVHDVFYGDQPLSGTKMWQSILAHCSETYDSFSRALQTKSGFSLNKMSLLDGELENSLSYLHRCITQCFERDPKFRARVELDCPENQVGERVKTAVLQDLLGRLHGWTKSLERRLEIIRQIKRHKRFHEKATGSVHSVPYQHDRQSTSSRSHAGYTASSFQLDPLLCDSLTPQIRPEISGLFKLGGSPDARAIRTAEEIIKSASQCMNSATISPSSQASRGRHLSPQQGSSRDPSYQVEDVCKLSDSSGVDPHSGPADHTMTEAPSMTPENPRRSFDAYMEEAGEFIDRQTRAMDLPPVSGKPRTVISL